MFDMKILTTLLLTACVLPAGAAPLTIAAASDLAPCMAALGKEFRKSVPEVSLKVSTAASGSLFAQLKNGAPFHVFMSADMGYPARLAEEGAADGNSLFQYATGKVVVWTSVPALDLGKGLGALLDPRVRRVSIANPEMAPYGKAAQQALRQAGVWDALQPRLVIGENLAQATQFAHTGNAQAALLSLTSVRSPKLRTQGRYRVLEGFDVQQGAVITSYGKGSPLAARWMAFLRSGAARHTLSSCGLYPPR